MKKLLIAVGLGLISGSLWAACMGPYCYDDSGAAINANVAMQSYTVTQLSTLSFRSAGVEVFCSNCGGGGNAGTVCVSTGTGNYATVLSTGTVCK